MSGLTTANDLLARHKATYLPTHQPFPTFAELGPQGKITHTAVVTCADPRCIPENFLGIHPGEAVVIRNIGGNVETALDTILALDTIIGINEVLVVKHTDCGSLAFTNDSVRDVLVKRAPAKKAEIKKMEFGSVRGKTLEDAVREQIMAVRGNVLLREELKPEIRGFVHDLVSGDLTEVEL